MVGELRMFSDQYNKIETLRKYSDLSPLLSIIYDRDKMFHVTGDRVYEDYMNEEFSITPVPGLFEMLEFLHSGGVSQYGTRKDVCASFMYEHSDFAIVIRDILNKDLSCGVNTMTINSAFPNLLKEFKVPLAKEFTDKRFQSMSKYGVFLSRKLDGIRCLCFILPTGEVEFYTRGNKPILTLDVLKRDIQEHWKGEKGVVLDGEICLFSNGVEDFQGILSEYRRKGHTIQNPRFYVFDYYRISAFLDGSDRHSFVDKNLQYLVREESRHVKVLSQIFYRAGELDPTKLSIPEGWEGYMIRGAGPTMFKRSDNLLKVKEFKEIEIQVIDLEFEDHYMDGKTRNVVSSLIGQIPGGGVVNVGSGMTWEQRIGWKEHPDDIIGKFVTVKYFNISRNKEGGVSLRFPTLKAVRSDI